MERSHYFVYHFEVLTLLFLLLLILILLLEELLPLHLFTVSISPSSLHSCDSAAAVSGQRSCPTSITFPLVNSLTSSNTVGCGQLTRRTKLWMPDREWRQEGSRGKALGVITYSKQVCCLWMWNLEISAIFLAAAISSCSTLTPTLFTFCQIC